ncbi:hypothetical protein [Deinococcus cellulosilyticus]|uniref:Uncharacterized protein n=1 Tax=Deinococcus cellulosilyticus (strain DSM 18568 / NBRC 106333 / KACC 11606 / 5516J-15) TaxID=1223518 RepID=A0A511NA05_DEIC1|nr:hypothetical protein [Deinococcus cellulosilyticus]GEM49659.1 hypothetical protein DC3_52940 [Deinococcus cellulosilyticus NBRC 106333 = KACC 11606]
MPSTVTPWNVNYYHSDTLTTDTDGGNLVMLCHHCAAAFAGELDGYAQDGDPECSCEQCDAGQDTEGLDD